MSYSFQIPPFTIHYQYPLWLWNVYPGYRLIKTEKVIYKSITFISKKTHAKQNSIQYHMVENLESVIRSKSCCSPLSPISLLQSQILRPVFKVYFQKSWMHPQACAPTLEAQDGLCSQYRTPWRWPHVHTMESSHLYGFMVWWCVVLSRKLLASTPLYIYLLLLEANFYTSVQKLFTCVQVDCAE